MSKKNYTAEEKFKIVKEALTTSTPVSEVCRKYSIHPNNFYNWQKLFLESALDGFNVKRGRPNTAEAARAAELEKENQRMKDVIAEITSENILLKKKALRIDLSAHIKPQLRAEIVADIKKHIKRSKMKLGKILLLYGIKMNTYRNWFNSSDEIISERKKRESALSAVLPEEKEAVKEFRLEHQNVGYRKLTWMMIDSGKAYLPETSVYRLLHEFGMIHMGTVKTYAEDEYKNKPKYVHHHWHTDIAYIKVGNIHYYLIMLLDGYSRFILGWELMTDMTEQSVSLFVQRVKEKYPHCNPMLIMDNGSQFISKDFKILISRIDIKPVHTRRNHPQTNGKIERLNGIVKNEAVKKYYPQNYSEACRILNDYVYEYNYARLHSGINYLRPSDMFFGRDKNILNERKSKLMLAKKCRVAKNKELMEFAS